MQTLKVYSLDIETTDTLSREGPPPYDDTPRGLILEKSGLHAMSSEHENGGASPHDRNDAPAASEHLNIKVTDNNNEVFFKIKRSTKLDKLMSAFCDRQGKNLNSVRFLFEGQRVQGTDTPDSVRSIPQRLEGVATTTSRSNRVNS